MNQPLIEALRWHVVIKGAELGKDVVLSWFRQRVDEFLFVILAGPLAVADVIENVIRFAVAVGGITILVVLLRRLLVAQAVKDSA